MTKWRFDLKEPFDVYRLLQFCESYGINILKTLTYGGFYTFKPEIHFFCVECDGDTKRILEQYPPVKSCKALNPERINGGTNWSRYR